MIARGALVALVVAACGRIGLDAQLARDAPLVPPDAHADAPIDPIGCADGTREAFADLAAFPQLAGCAATWSGTIDLRATGTAAAAACSPGWHLCGLTGDPTELSARATAIQCGAAAATGAFVAAMSHCTTDSPSCDYTPPLPCLGANLDCSEAVCCGPSCGIQNMCRSGVYPDPDTLVAPGDPITGACGALPATMIDGVLCCR